MVVVFQGISRRTRQAVQYISQGFCALINVHMSCSEGIPNRRRGAGTKIVYVIPTTELSYIYTQPTPGPAKFAQLQLSEF